MDAAKVVAHAVLGSSTDRVEATKVVTFAVLGTASTTMDAGKVVAFAVLEPGVETPTGQHRMLALF